MKDNVESFVKYQVAWYKRTNYDECGVEPKEMSLDKCEKLCNNFNITCPDYYHWPEPVANKR